MYCELVHELLIRVICECVCVVTVGVITVVVVVAVVRVNGGRVRVIVFIEHIVSCIFWASSKV